MLSWPVSEVRYTREIHSPLYLHFIPGATPAQRGGYCEKSVTKAAAVGMDALCAFLLARRVLAAEQARRE